MNERKTLFAPEGILRHRLQGYAQYVCVVDDCLEVAEVPVYGLPVESPECSVHEHPMMLGGWRAA